jgi:hypothetical protein
MLLLLPRQQVVGSSSYTPLDEPLPIRCLIISDDYLTRKYGGVSVCTDLVQTEYRYTNYTMSEYR